MMLNVINSCFFDMNVLLIFCDRGMPQNIKFYKINKNTKQNYKK